MLNIKRSCRFTIDFLIVQATAPKIYILSDNRPENLPVSHIINRFLLLFWLPINQNHFDMFYPVKHGIFQIHFLQMPLR